MNPEDSRGTFAAVDLGSNSFHMLIARFAHDKPHVLDRLRLRVRLAAGLGEGNLLDAGTQTRALEALGQFGERLRHLPPRNVRAVGTNTLRIARNSRRFLNEAVRVLGHYIEIVSGQEEARLIYLGVAHGIADPAPRRLVVDIGGGSTECIIGERFHPLRVASLYMGCVSHSQKYFPRGEITKEGMQAAETAARRELETIAGQYRSLGWIEALGSSGTVHAVETILRENGWTTNGIDERALKKLRKSMLRAGQVERLHLAGLARDRRPVLAGGLAILSAIFQSLEPERLISASGALREGVLYDLVGRSRHDDTRDRTVRSLERMYHVDLEQARRVERTALRLLDQVTSTWGLDDADLRKQLAWAARLHEIGLAIAYSGHHKHGAYLIANSELPGFSQDDQRFLAGLVHCHRRRVRLSLFRELPQVDVHLALRLCVLLRLAVLLNRTRSPKDPPPVSLFAGESSLRVRIPAGALEQSPLTRADLQDEATALAKVGFRLEVGPS